MMRLKHQTLARAALLGAATVLLATTIAALKLEPLPRAEAPAIPSLPELQPKQNRAAQTRIADADPFRIPPKPVAVEPEVITPVADADPVRLTGTAASPSGGIAVVESSAGSRVLRVGESWQGLRLRQVIAGEAVFINASTGEQVTLRIRKAGS